MQRTAPSPDVDHVDAVGSHAVADEFGMDARTARPGMFVILEHQHAGATGDDEAVAADVVRTRGGLRGVVVVR